jgi:hypothetical protein
MFELSRIEPNDLSTARANSCGFLWTSSGGIAFYQWTEKREIPAQ